jgi:hypothetical protein
VPAGPRAARVQDRTKAVGRTRTISPRRTTRTEAKLDKNEENNTDDNVEDTAEKRGRWLETWQ